MIWQSTLKQIFLTTITLQAILLSMGIAMQNQAQIKFDARKFAIDLDVVAFESYQLDESERLILSLYIDEPEFPIFLQPISKSNIRRSWGRFLGLDVESLDQALLENLDFDNFKQLLSYEYRKFQVGWRGEIARSTDSLKKYLKNPSSENASNSRTLFDFRYQELSYLLPRLKELLRKLDVGNAFHSKLETQYRLLTGIYDLRQTVDALAYIDGFHSEKGSLAYGRGHYLVFPKLPELESVTLFGLAWEPNKIFIYFSMLANAVFLSLLFRLVFISRFETFKSPPADTELWFIFALDSMTRRLLLIGVPALGGLTSFYMAIWTLLTLHTYESLVS